MRRLAASLGPFPLYLILVAIVAAIVALWSMSPGAYVIGGDAILPALNPDVALTHFWSSWNDAAGLGEDTSGPRPLLFPIVAIDWLLYHAHVPSTVLNNGWLVAILMMQAVSVAWLFRVLFSDVPKRYAIVAGVISVVNPYFLVTFHSPYPSTALSIATFPAVVASVLLLSKNLRLPELLRLLILFAIMAVGDLNYGVTLAEMIFLAPIVLVISKRTAGAAHRGCLIATVACAFLATNLIWILPAASFVSGSFHDYVAQSAAYSDSTLRVTSEYSALPNSVRLIGDYLFFNDAGNQPFLPEGRSYIHNLWVIVASCVLPVSAFLAGWLHRRNPRVVAVLVMSCVALFAAKGTSAPFGEAFQALVNHMPLFNAFRDSYSKLEWVVALGYALLAPLTLAHLGRSRNHFLIHATGAALLSGILLGGYPILLGHLFLKQSMTSIPKRYFEMARWFNERSSNGRILEMPVSPYFFDVYSWGYVGAGLNANLILRPIVSRMFDFPSPGTRALNDAFQSQAESLGTKAPAKLLGLLGVRYIIDDPAISPTYFNKSFWSEHLAERTAHISLVHRFGGITAHEIAADEVNPLFYAARNVYGGVRNLQDISDLCDLRLSCRDVAFLGDEPAEAVSTIGARIRYSQLRPHGSRGTELYYRAPLIGPSPRLIGDSSYSRDAGNRSFPPSSGQTGTALLYAGIPSVPVPGSAHVDVSKAFPVRVCSRLESNARLSYTFDGSRLSGRTVILSVVYSDAATPPLLRFSTNKLGAPIFYASLRMSRPRAAFLRFMRIPPGARAIRVWVELMRQNASRCVTVKDITITPVRLHHRRLRLLSDAAPYGATPPYVAMNPNAMTRYRDAGFESIVYFPGWSQTRESTQLTDAAVSWTDAESLAPADVAQRPVGLSAPAMPMQSLTVDRGSADVHASLGHLIPGAAYRILFSYGGLANGNLRVAVYSGAGELLHDDTIGTRSSGNATAAITMPANSSAAVVYVYLDSNGTQRATVYLGRLRIESRNPGFFVTIQGRSECSTPQSLLYHRSADGDYAVDVNGAPPRYILVMNNTYAKDWNLEGLRGEHAQHVTTNLFENGWIIEGKPSQRLRISYRGDRAIQVGLALGFIAFIGSISLVTFESRRDPR